MLETIIRKYFDGRTKKCSSTEVAPFLPVPIRTYDARFRGITLQQLDACGFSDRQFKGLVATISGAGEDQYRFSFLKKDWAGNRISQPEFRVRQTDYEVGRDRLFRFIKDLQTMGSLLQGFGDVKLLHLKSSEKVASEAELGFLTSKKELDAGITRSKVINFSEYLLMNQFSDIKNIDGLFGNFTLDEMKRCNLPTLSWPKVGYETKTGQTEVFDGADMPW